MKDLRERSSDLSDALFAIPLSRHVDAIESFAREIRNEALEEGIKILKDRSETAVRCAEICLVNEDAEGKERWSNESHAFNCSVYILEGLKASALAARVSTKTVEGKNE